MKMNQKGRGNDEFETPDYIFNQLNEIFNFTFDVACNESNCKCPYGYDEKWDALSDAHWFGRCFCNPPFSKKAEFIIKADSEVQGGVLYMRNDTAFELYGYKSLA